MELAKYVVSIASEKYIENLGREEIYYCHKEGYPYVPVFGSIGDYQKAMGACNLMNRRGRDKHGAIRASKRK